MDEFRMDLDTMITTLDTACGMLLVASMRNDEVREAMELVTKVSMSLGEVENIKFIEYGDELDD